MILQAPRITHHTKSITGTFNYCVTTDSGRWIFGDLTNREGLIELVRLFCKRRDKGDG